MDDRISIWKVAYRRKGRFHRKQKLLTKTGNLFLAPAVGIVEILNGISAEMDRDHFEPKIRFLACSQEITSRGFF